MHNIHGRYDLVHVAVESVRKKRFARSAKNEHERVKHPVGGVAHNHANVNGKKKCFARSEKDEHEQMAHHDGHVDQFHVLDVSESESGIDTHPDVLNVDASEIESETVDGPFGHADHLAVRGVYPPYCGTGSHMSHCGADCSRFVGCGGLMTSKDFDSDAR